MKKSRSIGVDRIRESLSRVDWDFQGSGTNRASIHSLHWFPGNFIGQIPAFLVQILSQPKDLVLDPFCGSGTAPIEAALLNRRGIGSDTNPAALQVASAKVAILSAPNEVRRALKRSHDALVWPSMVHSDDPGRNNEGSSPELLRWFHPETLRQLRGIWQFAVEPASSKARAVLNAIFTDTLFACAAAHVPTRTGGSRRHHWGWVADNVRPTRLEPHDAVGVFDVKIRKVLQIMSVVANQKFRKCHLIAADARQLPVLAESVDLVVTSPPYLEMIDYSRANRLTYLWFNWSLASSERIEIGARFRRGRQDVLDVYMNDMTEAADEIARCLRPGAFCAVVIGSSRRIPIARDSAIEVFASKLDQVWGPVNRTGTRRRVSERAGRQVEEAVCVFRKSL